MDEFDFYVVTMRDPETLRTFEVEFCCEDSNDAWGDAQHAYPDYDVVKTRRK